MIVFLLSSCLVKISFPCMHAFFCCGSHVLCFYQNVGLGPLSVGCAFSQSAFRCSGRWNDDSVAEVGYGLGLCFLSHLGCGFG